MEINDGSLYCLDGQTFGFPFVGNRSLPPPQLCMAPRRPKESLSLYVASPIRYLVPPTPVAF